MKTDVITGVRQIFQSGVMPAGVIDISIVLIPKRDQAEALKDYRPISVQCDLQASIKMSC
jgi:hypothetical protein